MFVRQLSEIRDPKIIAKKTAQLEMKEVQKYARRNIENSMTATIIPRTMREPQCNVSKSIFINILYSTIPILYYLVNRNQQWSQINLLLYLLKN